MTASTPRGLSLRSKVTARDVMDVTSGTATSTGSGGTSPGAAGYAPSPHSMSSAHHTGEIGASQATWAAYTEGSGTDRPAYNANRMTGALAHIVPSLTDTYDIGTPEKWFRQQYVSQINAAVFAENVIQLLGGWFVVGHGQGTLQMPTAYLQVETATVLGAITTGVAQVETATVSGTATAAGTMTVVVTAAGMTGSPITTNVPFVLGATASEMAALIRAALSFVANITAYFTIGGSSAAVALTRKSAAANDATLNIALSGASAQGFADAATSANTTAGVASGAGNATVIVTANGMTNSPKTVSVAVADADTAALVAGKIRTALAADANVGAFFTVSGSSASVVLTSVAYTVSNDATMNISIDNGTCTGLTAAPTSTNTTAGGDRTDINFGTGTNLAVNDFILIKGHDVTGTIKTEYMQVTVEVTPGSVYTVVRDKANAHITDPVWAEGTPWLNLGYTGDGRIEFDAYNTPRINLFTQGSAFNAQTEVVRVGDLNANWGYDVETYGVAMGPYAAGKTWLALDPTKGIRIMHGNPGVQLARWYGDAEGAYAAGDLVIGRDGASQNNVLISAGAISIRNNVTERIGMTAAGVVTIKDSGGNAVITLDAALGAEITKKLTMPGASSAIAIGTTPPTSATVGTGIWIDRTGMYGLAANVQQAIFDATTGKLTAGAGAIYLDNTGLNILIDSAGWVDSRAIDFYDSVGGTNFSSIYNYGGAGSSNTMAIVARSLANTTSRIDIMADAPATYLCRVFISAGSGGVEPSIMLTADSDASPARIVAIDADQLQTLGVTAITTNQTTIALLNTTATTINAFGAATAVTVTTTGFGIGTTEPGFRLTTSYTAPATFTNAAGDFLQMWQTGSTNALGVALSTTGKHASIVSNNDYDIGLYTSGVFGQGLTVQAYGGNVAIGGTAARASTVGTNHLDIFNGTAPVGTLANGISLYSSGGEAYVMDAAGNSTLLSHSVDVAAHVAATGTAVHGLGTISTQAASAVAITGGTIAGLTSLQVGTGAIKTLEIAEGSGDLYVGSNSQDGNIIARNMAGTTRVELEAANGRIYASVLTGGATTLSVDANGWIIRTPSDGTLKTSFATITDPLAKALALKGWAYEWKDVKRFGEGVRYGMVAQEVGEVIPEGVSGSEYLSIDPMAVVSVLVEAFKVQQGEIADLRARLARLAA